MKRVLLVDDSNTILDSLQRLLSRLGFAVDTAHSGEEAIGCVRRAKPDLVISDVHMPGMDGIALVGELRKLPNMRFTPILMLTTESQRAKRDEAKAAGASGWMVKPVKSEVLKEAIGKFLPGSC